MGGFIQKIVISEGKPGIAQSLHPKFFKIARYFFSILRANLAQFRFSVQAILYRTQVIILFCIFAKNLKNATTLFSTTKL